MSQESGTATVTAPATTATGKAASAGEGKTGEGKAAEGAAAAAAETKVEPKPGEAKPGEKEGAAAKPGAESQEKHKEGDKLVKDELKLPEGSLLDPKAVDEIKALAKEKGWSPEQAKAVLEREDKAVHSYVETEQAKLKQRVESWKTECSTDKEIGGESYKENAELASRIVKKYFPQQFHDVLDKTGLGNYPDFVRGFVRIAKATGEDRLVIPEAGARGGKKSPEQALYGETSQKSDGKEN